MTRGELGIAIMQVLPIIPENAAHETRVSMHMDAIAALQTALGVLISAYKDLTGDDPIDEIIAALRDTARGDD